MPEFVVSGLNIYPVKSLKPLPVNYAEVDHFGFRFDRRFVLVDREGTFISQRKYPILSQLRADFDGEALCISSTAFAELRFLIDEFVSPSKVSVWSDTVAALILQDARTQVLSEFLGVSISLAYMPDTAFRQVDRKFFDVEQPVSFADGFPFLLANQVSLNDLNSKLNVPVGMERFRPNIVFEGDLAFQEDEWQRIKVGEVGFQLVKPCSRCVMTCIDEQGIRQKEPLKTLASYRKNEFGVCFGQNMVQLNAGKIALGDKLRVVC